MICVTVPLMYRITPKYDTAVGYLMVFGSRTSFLGCKRNVIFQWFSYLLFWSWRERDILVVQVPLFCCCEANGIFVWFTYLFFWSCDEHYISVVCLPLLLFVRWNTNTPTNTPTCFIFANPLSKRPTLHPTMLHFLLGPYPSIYKVRIVKIYTLSVSGFLFATP